MEQQKLLEQIKINYGMGFITYGEYCCQRAHAKGQMKKWHALCLVPSWVFSLIENRVTIIK